MPKKSKKNTKQSRARPVHVNKFNIKKLEYTELDLDNEFVKSQGMAFPRYNGQRAFLFKTDFIELTQYGIPKSTANDTDVDYYDHDLDRSFLKIPFDPEQEATMNLRAMLEKIDKYWSRKGNRKLFFAVDPDMPDFYKAFDYLPTIKNPVSLTSPNIPKKIREKLKDKVRHQFCKLKFALSYPDKDIETSVYIRDTMDSEPRELDVKTVSDIDKYLTIGSKFRLIGAISKVWAALQSKGGKTQDFSVSLKIWQIEIVPNPNTSLKKEFQGGLLFDSSSESSDEDDEDNDAESDTESDDEKADDSDEEEKPKKKKKSSKKTKEESDSDVGSDSDDD